MTEEQLRALVREAVARYAGPGAGRAAPPSAASPTLVPHASHAMFSVPAGSETGGWCLIEPAVPCNHCGYCRSYGH